VTREAPRARKRAWWLLGEAMLIAGVLVASLSVLGAAAGRRLTDPSFESLYLRRARYFTYLFVQHDVGRREWGDSQATHTQPMLANYVVGGWLWAYGYDLESMIGRYDTSKTFRENLLQGTGPDRALVARARQPMVLIAAGTMVLIYVLGRSLGGPVAGLGCAALALASPLLQRELTLATNQAPLAFFIVLALLVSVLGARRGRGGRLALGWALGLGVALGLGFGTKLTAALSLTAVLGWGMIVTVRAAGLSGRPSLRTRLRHAGAAGRGWALALAVGLGLFVLSDPHLYPNPLLHTAHLFEKRRDEMLDQQRDIASAVSDPLDRPGYVLHNSLVEGTWSGTLELPLEAALATVGAAALAVRTRRGWRRTGQLPAEGLVLLTILTYFAGVSAGLLLDFDRYYVPTLLLGTVLSGIGCAVAAGRVAVAGAGLKQGLDQRWRRYRSAERSTASAPSTATTRPFQAP
jgi:hypothetical protein